MIVIGSEGGRFPTGLLLASSFWILCFGYFVSGHSSDYSSCIAVSTDEFPSSIPVIDGNYASEIELLGVSVTSVDVAHRFKIFFTIGCFLSVFQLVIGILSRLVNLSIDAAKLFFNLYHFSQMAFLINWVAIFYFRLQPSAMTCCGALVRGDRSSFLYTQGLFITVAGAIIVLIAGITVLAGLIALVRGKSTL